VQKLRSEGRWSTCVTTFEPKEAGLFAVMWNPNDTKGKEQSFFIRDIWLIEAP